jgi:hypothetical protein
MRLSICTAIIASATLVGQCTAVPSFRASSQAAPPESEAVGMAKRDDEEALKYFHEPGCVARHCLPAMLFRMKTDHAQQ